MAEQWEVCFINEGTLMNSGRIFDLWWEALTINALEASVLIKTETLVGARDQWGNYRDNGGEYAPEVGVAHAKAYQGVVQRLLADGWEPLERTVFRRKAHS